MSCVRTYDERDEGVFVPWHNVEGAPGAFQGHGRTTVSDQLPVGNH